MVVTAAIPPRMGSIGIMVVLLCWGGGVLSGSFPDIPLCAKPVPKGKCDFQAKIAGWRIRTICVDGCIYKIVYRNTFSYAMQNKKGPAGAEPKICQQKRKQMLSGLPRSHRSLAMTFQTLTAPQGERSNRACTGIAEPKGSYTAGVESTVCRGMLSEVKPSLNKRGVAVS